MARKKVSTTVYLEPEQVRDLKALSDSTREPQASMIRQAIQDYLDDRRSEIPVAGPDPRQVPIDFMARGTISHCYGGHCRELTEGRCICLCEDCARAKKADR